MNYEDLVDELVSTIRLGYEAEVEIPASSFTLAPGASGVAGRVDRQ